MACCTQDGNSHPVVIWKWHRFPLCCLLSWHSRCLLGGRHERAVWRGGGFKRQVSWLGVKGRQTCTFRTSLCSSWHLCIAWPFLGLVIAHFGSLSAEAIERRRGGKKAWKGGVRASSRRHRALKNAILRCSGLRYSGLGLPQKLARKILFE